ncbi:MAG: hypothetical protein HS130_03990 [Deltaproteobacteria bacterium]|nr:hypothetical protein [Deltaproteobacteria bacterium]MCL4873768.1 hypothetical protein [bacterium]
MRRQLIIILAAVFLFTGVGLSFHHHEDGHLHEDCQVCAVASHQKSVTPSSVSWTPELSVLFVLSTAFFICRPFQIQSRKKTRAPPLF